MRLTLSHALVSAFTITWTVLPTAAQEVEPLIRQLDDHSFGARKLAYHKLLEIGERALPALRDAKDNESAEVRFGVQALIDAISRVTLYTLTEDGRLIRLKVYRRNVQQQVIAKLGMPFGRQRFHVRGLAMSPDGMLYAIADWPRTLYRIDPRDGTTNRIGTTAATKVNSLAFCPHGKLYGGNWSCSRSESSLLEQFITIDINTGMATSSHLDVGAPRIAALAINKTGIAVFLDDCHGLWQLRLDSAMPEESPMNDLDYGQLGVRDAIQSICFAADGTLYGVCNNRQSFLVRFDWITGKMTSLGQLGFGTRNLAAGRSQNAR